VLQGIFQKPGRDAVLLTIVLAIAAALRLWRLDDNGFGSEYYAAGVRSMLQSWHLFFYGSFDPAGYISLDKPPLAFWLQALFAWVFGYSGLVIHLPQALLGTASVALLYFLVRRYFDATAGLIAAAIFAIAPIAVAIDRSNNTDSLLIFLLLASAHFALRGGGRNLVLAMVMLGLAFNVKMLAALVCGPALLAGWLLATQMEWQRRLAFMAAAGLVLVAVSLSWAALFDLTPKGERPYAGSSTSNSMLQLVVVHNGLERFSYTRPADAGPPSAYPLYDSEPVGALRLAQPNLAAQFAWFLPLAVMGAILAWRRQRASVALWALWALCYGLVYSAAGGIFHLYYLSTLVPPLCALAGIGSVELWKRDRRWLAATLGVTALGQALILYGHVGDLTLWLIAPLVALLAALALWRWSLAAAIGGIALTVLPLAWALSAIFAPGNLLLPSTSLARWLGQPDGRGPVLSRNQRALSDDPRMDAYVLARRGEAKYALTAFNTYGVAPFIIHTGAPALAIGGFAGNDPTITLEDFKAMVGRGEVRFILLPAILRSRTVDYGGERNKAVADWVRANGKVVPGAQWRSQPVTTQRILVLYDLRPG
jgi:4-amino-4-deoxy-L-arabinose transferase-like glycosyltransferase